MVKIKRATPEMKPVGYGEIPFSAISKSAFSRWGPFIRTNPKALPCLQRSIPKKLIKSMKNRTLFLRLKGRFFEKRKESQARKVSEPHGMPGVLPDLKEKPLLRAQKEES